VPQKYRDSGLATQVAIGPQDNYKFERNRLSVKRSTRTQKAAKLSLNVYVGRDCFHLVGGTKLKVKVKSSGFSIYR
jgi:hypothetical protein